MLIKTNKTKELVESKLGIDFKELKWVGCRKIPKLQNLKRISSRKSWIVDQKIIQNI